MFSQLRMREEQALLAHDYALEQAEEQGLKKGLVNLVRQHLLIAEIASQQLSMTVAEFEELLKDHTITNNIKVNRTKILSCSLFIFYYPTKHSQNSIRQKRRQSVPLFHIFN